MALQEPIELTEQAMETLAWKFLGSKFTEHAYANWPIDRRVDAYLRHYGQMDIVSDGAVRTALLGCIMANLGHARRRGVLGMPEMAASPGHPTSATSILDGVRGTR